MNADCWRQASRSQVPVQQGTSALPAGETIDLGETAGKWKVCSTGRRTSPSSARPRSSAMASSRTISPIATPMLIGASTDTSSSTSPGASRTSELAQVPTSRGSRTTRSELAVGARHPRQGRGCRLARDLHRRSRQRDPARDGQRPQRRPQPGTKRSACSTRCRPTSSARATGQGRRGPEARRLTNPPPARGRSFRPVLP